MSPDFFRLNPGLAIGSCLNRENFGTAKMPGFIALKERRRATGIEDFGPSPAAFGRAGRYRPMYAMYIFCI
jgi:hypothetical protein